MAVAARRRVGVTPAHAWRHVASKPKKMLKLWGLCTHWKRPLVDPDPRTPNVLLLHTHSYEPTVFKHCADASHLCFQAVLFVVHSSVSTTVYVTKMHSSIFCSSSLRSMTALTWRGPISLPLTSLPEYRIVTCSHCYGCTRRKSSRSTGCR